MPSKQHVFACSLLAVAFTAANAAIAAETQNSETLESVEVVGEQVDSYRVTDMDTATGLGLSIMDAPQSVSAIGNVQMDDFNMYNLNDALRAVPGIQVESVETDRTYYSSRGFDVTNVQVDGEGYGTSKVTEVNGKVLLYAGVVYSLTDNYSLYASHTETFRAQDDIAKDLSFIDPIEGVNDEVGVKGQFFGGKLIATLAYYLTQQNNVAEFAGQIDDPNSDQVMIDYYEGRDYDSNGYDLTLSGEIIDGLNMEFSYAKMDIENKAGNGLNRDFIPEQTEPPRVSRRLHLLREWSPYEQTP